MCKIITLITSVRFRHHTFECLNAISSRNSSEQGAEWSFDYLNEYAHTHYTQIHTPMGPLVPKPIVRPTSLGLSQLFYIFSTLSARRVTIRAEYRLAASFD